MHGFYWYAHVVALTQEHVRWLHISVLELLATGFSTIIFTPLLPPGAKRLTHGADATATVTTLTRETESSEILMLTHHALLQCDQFKALAPRADLGHLRGDSNLGADAVSRALWDTFARTAATSVFAPFNSKNVYRKSVGVLCDTPKYASQSFLF